MLIASEGEVARYCTNVACPAQLREKLLHFAGRGGMDVQGLGESLVDQLLGKGLVSDVTGIYGLTSRSRSSSSNGWARSRRPT